ncbi:MAG TPA: hypothetical protein VNT55_09630 [Baekduia sp.]|nr:hypothetical protein [Baekduia sp.]
MSRRVLAVLSVVCVAALSVTAVALAHNGRKDGDKTPTKHARVLGGGLFGASLDSLAQRLSVDPAALRTAVRAVAQEQFDKKLAAAGLTPEEIAAVKACRTHGVKKRDPARVRTTAATSCDTAALKSASTKLKAYRKAHPTPDLAALKTELATSLASKIGKTPDDVLTAVRAELDARLRQAVAAGWLTQKGHDLALACFDDPASCDLKALRAEVTLFGHKKHHKPGGSGQMHPGGRATSTPLR